VPQVFRFISSALIVAETLTENKINLTPKWRNGVLTQLSKHQAEFIAIQFNILSGRCVWVLQIFRRLTQLSIHQAELIAIQFNTLSGGCVWVLPIFRRFKG